MTTQSGNILCSLVACSLLLVSWHPGFLFW